MVGAAGRAAYRRNLPLGLADADYGRFPQPFAFFVAFAPFAFAPLAFAERVTRGGQGPIVSPWESAQEPRSR